MSIKTMLSAAIAAVYMFPASALLAQGDVKINPIPVSDNIYMLSGQGGNIGLFLGEDGTFIIDDQFAPLTEKILAAIKSVEDAIIHDPLSDLEAQWGNGIFSGEKWIRITYPAVF
jgi:hypothetical protein